MSNLKEDFETHLLNELQPIVQREEHFQTQNLHRQNSFMGQENSFISDRIPFQTENSNPNIPDYTLYTSQNHFHSHHQGSQRQDHKLFKKGSEWMECGCDDAMESKEYKNSSKLQEDLSQEKSILPGSDNVSVAQDYSSFTDQDYSEKTVRGPGRRRVLCESLEMSHREHLILGGKVISGLEKNIVSLPFREPVDVQRYNIPDYLQVIKQPMDLRTIKRKIADQQYVNVEEIYRDIDLIIGNSMRYNELNADFIRLTRNFEKSYHKIRRDCERNMRKFKLSEDKKNESFVVHTPAQTKHSLKPCHNNFPSNDVQITSNFQFSELIRLAKRIKKLIASEQIELFSKIGIRDKLVVDIKLLTTKEIRVLIKELERMEKGKEQMIQEEEKKENSRVTVCSRDEKCIM